MAVVSKLTTIGIMVFSLGIGFLTFYLLSNLTKEQRKKHLEEWISQFINFVIFIWLGKIMLNLSIFVTDPLSILAYPSNSKAFYFAVVSTALLLLYKSKRKNLHVRSLLGSFVPVFLIGSFTYEFIQVVWNDDRYALGYLLLLGILIGLFFFFRERTTSTVLFMIVITVWSGGLISLLRLQPFVTVFGYIMDPWFIGVFFVMSMGGLIYKLRKGDT